MFGRAGRLPNLRGVALVIAEPWAFSTEESEKLSNAEKRTDMDVHEYISLTTCRRAFKAKNNDNNCEEEPQDTGSAATSPLALSILQPFRRRIAARVQRK
ncbi:hypothetical protein CONPUDRAFT_160715 [Coniophora puteana RWD-64-598 SS2]|uniref:Uncharacterized protein n=1 Tax=Coniophora puteana (strain RWD-64-598) TaxID=741705 RepID=R7SD59_CONPW|nr:uncharacterized protein CONPUDRAFT_160715 [Coniophora puteana RWD-64-598 SS2]EIW73785.1 hypothetical protein CONPUDRAFT_160715 [Coniophora puteana RWD-64-598 SS2]